MIRELGYALRQMRKNPGFTAVAVMTLACGIGANTAIFSLINSLMLRSLPVRHPNELVQLLSGYPGEPWVNGFSWKVYEHFRDENHVFSDLTGISRTSLQISGDGLNVHAANGEYVAGNFFSSLGVKPAVGRLIAPPDDQLGAPAANSAVLSWGYWNTKFNRDPRVIGKEIMVNRVPATVVGVAQEEFSGIEVGVNPDLWLPTAAEPMMNHPSRRVAGTLDMMLIARLGPAVSIQQARAEMGVLNQWRMEEVARTNKDPAIRQLKLEVAPAANGFSTLRDRFAKPLMLLMSIVIMLLLIACTNVASMLLGRGAARQHEMAVRISLGAGRFRLFGQALTESLLLTAVSGVLGLCLAYFGTRLLVGIIVSARRIPGMPPRLAIAVHMDARVLLFTAAVALFTAVLFGLAPVWSVFKASPLPTLHGTARSGQTRVQRRFNQGLIIAQVALSMVLLSAAGLFVGYLSALQHTDLGFRRDHVLLVTLDPSHSGYDKGQLVQLYRELVQRLEAIPGVRSATLSAVVPLSGAGASDFVDVDGYQENPDERRYVALNWVAPKYFQTFGTSFLSGRDFSFDDAGKPLVAIVNEAMASHYFPNRNPIGEYITFKSDHSHYKVVGVVANAHYRDVHEPIIRTVYVNAFQGEDPPPSKFAIRTAIQSTAIAADVRRTVDMLLKSVPVANVTTLDEHVDAAIVPERLIGMVSGMLGVLGTLLTAVGLYGLLGYMVTRRTHEIGVRIAVGADRSNITKIILGDAVRTAAIGLVAGAVAAFWVKHFATALIEDVPLRSASPIIAASLMIIIVVLLAAYIPSRRAATVDPLSVLMFE